MKHFIKFFIPAIVTALVILLIAFAGCNGGGEGELEAQAVRGGRLWQSQESGSATAAASITTNLAFSKPEDLRGQPDVSVRFGATNVSGTTGGTVSFQQTNDPDQTRWHTVDTFAYTGGTDTLFAVSDFTGYNLRLSAVNNGTTQSTTFNTDWVVSNPSKDH